MKLFYNMHKYTAVRLRENLSGLQTKTEGNTSSIRGKQRNNRNTEVQQNNNRQCNIHRNEL